MNKKKQRELYFEMVLIRRLEERAAQLYQQGKIGGFLHLYIGQEAVGSGVIASRQPQDRVITAYRDHGIAISSVHRLASGSRPLLTVNPLSQRLLPLPAPFAS